MAITHSVFLKTIGTDEAVLEALDSVRQLVGVIPGVLTFEAGKYSSPEGLNRGYTWGFTMVIADAASRDAYLIHPAHFVAAAKVVAVCEGGVNDVFAFDYEK